MQLCIKPKCMSQDAKEADTKRNRARQQTLITFNVMLILAKPASNAIQQYMGYTIKKRDATPHHNTMRSEEVDGQPLKMTPCTG